MTPQNRANPMALIWAFCCARVGFAPLKPKAIKVIEAINSPASGEGRGAAAHDGIN